MSSSKTWIQIDLPDLELIPKHPIASIAGRIPLLRFARALYPSQAAAVGTRSSLVCLPFLLEGAEKIARLPKSIVGLVIPLSTSTFRVSKAISSPLKLLFLVHIYDIQLEPLKLILSILIILLISFASPGLPSPGKNVTLPVYLAAGIPIEPIIILHAVDFIPDIFKTLLNVTEHMTVTTIVSRFSPNMVSEPSLDIEEAGQSHGGSLES